MLSHCRRIWFADPKAVEVALFFFAFFAGTRLVWPVDTISPPFRLLGKLFPEYWWGVLFISLAAATIGAAVCGKKLMRSIICFVAFWMWAFISGTALFADWRVLATVLYPVIMLMAGWAFLRIANKAE